MTGNSASVQDMILNEIKSMRLDYTSGHNKVMEKLQNMEKNNETTKKRTDLLESKMKHMDRDGRKRNIIIYGVVEKDNESFRDLQNIVTWILNEKLESDIRREEIDDYFRLGRRTNGQKPRPIIIKLLSYWRKREIMSNSSKLKGTNLFIANDLSFEDGEEMKKLRKEMKELRNQGHQVTIKGNKLIVDGVLRNKSTQHMRAGEDDNRMETETPINNHGAHSQNNMPSASGISNTPKRQISQISPETLATIYKDTNVEEQLKKKKKLFGKGHIRSNSVGQPTLDNLGIQITQERNEGTQAKTNIGYQQIVHVQQESSEGNKGTFEQNQKEI
ncbi:hypothetical protein M8J77_012404 [Diaphorina citri]|nr:hypothetical protein M8J77_012404 [Diaphorina citri]